MEPGAGGGSFKFLRGFDPYIVNSVHAFTSKELGNAVGDFLLQERRDNNVRTASND
jgi:predicted N-acyltransferase